MTNFNNSKIYKITSEASGLTYYGSTTMSLYNRMIRHRAAYQRYTTGASVAFTSSFMVLGHDDAEISLVEIYSCNSNRELCEREGHYIRNNECVNLNIAGRTTQQYYQDNKERYAETNRSYYERKGDYHRAYMRNANSEPVECFICNRTIRKGSVKSHKRTWKHIINLLRTI